MRVLAVSGSSKSLESMITLIKEAGIDAFPSPSGAQARQRVLDEEWDEVIINYPLSDESGFELALMIQEETSAECIVLVKSDDPGTIAEFNRNGIITVEKPIVRPIFHQSIHLAYSIKKRMERSAEKTRRLERKVEDLKAESKAKCILSLKHGFSEDEGHKFLERMAMDRRITLRQAAEYIIREEG